MTSHPAIPHSRRAFLARLAGIAATPLILNGCRRSADGEVGQTPPPSGGNLDEPENAAFFRPPPPTLEPVVRVRVMKVRGRPGETVLRLGSQEQWLRLRRADGHGRGSALYGPATVALADDGWSITDAKGFRAAAHGREAIELSALEDTGSTILEVSASNDAKNVKPRQYPGVLRLVSRHDLQAGQKNPPPPGDFDLVNHVPVENYLPGVLAGELYAHWQLETFAAQAIAARSFAITENAVFLERRHYDLTNTAASQMYLGSVDHQKAGEAVAITRGVVLTHESLLVSGYYSSCCGGAAACAADAIGANPVNNALPLRGRTGVDVCTSASVYRWKSEQSIDLLTRRVQAFGQEEKNSELKALSRLEGIAVAETNAHGRARQIALLDDRGRSAVLAAEDFRRAANYSGQGLAPPDKPLKSSHLTATFSRAAVTFEGFGFGHGVGLCQHGAETLAKAGTDHRAIVQWYYPAAEIVKAYV